jgi:hypothetical protein
MLKSVSPQLSPKNSDIRVVRLSPEQQQVLEAQFGRVKNPHNTDLVLLAAETGLHELDVQVGPIFLIPDRRLEIPVTHTLFGVVFRDFLHSYHEKSKIMHFP